MFVFLSVLTTILFVMLLFTNEGNSNYAKKSMPIAIAYSVTVILMVIYEIWSKTPKY